MKQKCIQTLHATAQLLKSSRRLRNQESHSILTVANHQLKRNERPRGRMRQKCIKILCTPASKGLQKVRESSSILKVARVKAGDQLSTT
uniref:Putative ovule protein n=1 Tax=Solanum chacoense TaxID=4108 RepID=A0A0V0IP49_SOLCH